MIRLAMAATILTAAAAMTFSTTAQAYIGEGVQGRPHGGHTAQRMLFRRHGLAIPYKYRKRHHYRSRGY